MSDSLAAARYTHALFELADRAKVLDEMDHALDQVAALLKNYPLVLRLAENPTLSNEEKGRLAQSLLDQNAPELLSRFLKVLIEKRRFALLPAIQVVFHKSYEKKQGIRQVEMASAVLFSKGFYERLTATLKKRLRSEIRLFPKTEPDLLGGFILRFDGKEIDCSFKNRIDELRKKLLNPIAEGNDLEGQPL